ncbi:unnamed protein product [Didymodactylos carnosus]|uniref:Stress-induced-phosphoprotein 1 n=1 Tax=Didymodactylos carnosus TaxID=1234261 RepID=A0A813V468_9BILA|nr:unnamed protein product [Didymodactylos carnosus]CAF1134157.1 unnamed protein product [Didymodactylos carnosus]CAF3623008.1 unnamed protein product [Didymodactylos carnosus]CAF3921042.1 unnamed protein product [Didymodactylos carnosus]
MASQVEELKTKANTAFQAGKNEEAAKYYTEAIQLDDKNHVLYSNRSAAYAKMNKYEDALKDAEQCIALKPDFVKGYSRKGASLSYLKRHDDAIKAYEEGLRLDPQNQQLLDGLGEVKAAQTPTSSNPFGDPQFLMQLMANPKARELMKDPETARLMQQFRTNPNNPLLFQNPKVMKVLGAALGFELGGENDDEMTMRGDPAAQPSSFSTSKPSTSSASNTSKTTNAAKDDVNKNLTPAQRQAEEEKDKGNEAYKKKDFTTALQHYDKAIELDNNMKYYTNKAAVYYEQGQWDNCIEQCLKAIEIGRENKADYKLIAKAYARIGNVHSQQKDYQSAIKYFNHSLSEHRNPEVLKKKQEIEKILKDEESKAYVNPEIANEEKNKGNEYFQKGDFPTALKHYSEAIKRNPTDPKLYSNRAACYSKLMEFPLTLKDCEEAIKLDPTFLKAYLRKGTALIAMKDLGQAMSTFSKALEIDPNCQEAIEGYRSCTMKANSDPEEVRKRAMNDPEVQSILGDPGMRIILEQMQNEPQALREHLKNPAIAHKIQKLIDVGIIAIR